MVPCPPGKHTFICTHAQQQCQHQKHSLGVLTVTISSSATSSVTNIHHIHNHLHISRVLQRGRHPLSVMAPFHLFWCQKLLFPKTKKGDLKNRGDEWTYFLHRLLVARRVRMDVYNGHMCVLITIFCVA